MGRRAERPFPIHLVYLAEACRVVRWLRSADVQHLHAHFGTNSAEVAMLVNVLGGPPWSFTAHGPEEFDKAQFIGLAEKIRRAAFVIAVSSFGRSQLFRWVAASSIGTRSLSSIAASIRSAFPASRPIARPRALSASAASVNKKVSYC